MNIEGIGHWQPLSISWREQMFRPPAAGESFQQLLIDGIRELNTQQIEANEQVKAFLSGEGPALHEVMLRAEEVKLTLEFAVQLRNKLLDAYNEIMRMQM